jgi:hypothetical protein
MVGTSESHKISKSLDCLSQLKRKKKKKERRKDFKRKLVWLQLVGGANPSSFFFLKRKTLKIT